MTAAFETRDLAANMHAGDDGLFYVMCEDDNDTEPEPNLLRRLYAMTDDLAKIFRLT